MTINVCVNGTFRYPQYIRHYAEAGVLGAYYLAHRRATTGAGLVVGPAYCRNVWWKEYALQVVARLAPDSVAPRAALALCDLWQADVIRHWRDCDSVEAVIGAVADRVIDHARARGSRIIGHPVQSHPDNVGEWVGRAYAETGLDPRQALLPGRERRLAEIAACDRLVVDSTFVARSFVERGVSPERIAVITPGVDLGRFYPADDAPRQRQPFRVVCVGTLTPRKGQHVLLRAWRTARLPDAELVLVGPPGRGAAAVVRGFAGTFRHLPRVDNACLRDLLVTASVFVLPSVEDGFAQAPFEAMACGVPVIVTSNSGVADLIEEGVNGFVVPPLDPEAIQIHLETLFRDPDRVVAMGRAALATTRRVGSWPDYVGRMLEQHRLVLGAAQTTAEAA